MNKKYIILGWGDRKTDKNYQELFKRVPNLVWLPTVTRNPKLAFGKKSLNETTDELSFVVDTPVIDTLVGFSAGAIIAYMLSKKIKVNKLILCSLSPILGDKIIPKKSLKLFTKEQIKELKVVKWPTLKDALILYGDKEKNFGGITVKDSGHKIEGNYLKVLIKILND